MLTETASRMVLSSSFLCGHIYPGLQGTIPVAVPIIQENASFVLILLFLLRLYALPSY